MRLLILLLLIPSLAHAGKCSPPPDDKWNGPDKPAHFMIGALPAVVAGTQLKDPWTGFLIGSAFGVGVEVLSAVTGNGVCTPKDAIVGIVGAGFGAWGSHVFIQLKPGGAHVTATWELK